MSISRLEGDDLGSCKKSFPILRFIMLCIQFLLIGCENNVNAVIPTIGDDYYSLPKVIGNIENPIVKDYISNVDYQDDDYTYTEILDYCYRQTDWDKTCPSPINISVHDSIVQRLTSIGIDSLVVQTYRDNQLFRVDSHVLDKEIPIYNLIPGLTYYYTVLQKVDDNTFHQIIDGLLEVDGRFRAIYVEGMHNFRDIGGYATLYGRRIKYDKLFRSAELQRQTNPSQGDITARGVNELINNLRIDVELDFGDAYTVSPVQNLIEFISDKKYNISYYDIGLNPESTGYTGERYKNCFDIILERLKQGKKVLFHCNLGADRTGTLAFILEALLGVNESDLAKDYEITSFFQGYIRRRDSDYVLDRNSGYPAMISYIKTHFDGENINEKVENMMLSLGVTHAQIEEFRQIMLEDNDDNLPTSIIHINANNYEKKSSMLGGSFNLSGIRMPYQQHGITIVDGQKKLK